MGETVGQSTAFEVLARAGFAARGLIYGIIGVLAVKLALGAGGKTTDQSGALKTIAHQPFGRFLLIAVAIGFAGYALWRFMHVFLGHGPEKSDSGFDRVGALGSGIAYAFLCVLSIEILLGSAGSSSARTTKATGGVLGWPGGTWIVGIAGAVLIGTALYQGYRGLTKDFLEDAKTGEMGPTTKRVYKWLAILVIVPGWSCSGWSASSCSRPRSTISRARRSAWTARWRSWRTSRMATRCSVSSRRA